MKRSGMETRNKRVNPRGNSGTSFPHSLPSHDSELTSELVEVVEAVEVAEVVGVTAAVDDVEVVTTDGGWVFPP